MKEPADLEKMVENIDRQGMRTWLIKALTKAFKEARKHKLKTFNEHIYEENWSENIIKLVDAILERHYRPSSSISFVIFDPMVREIFAAPFVDRIVHHFLYELQGGWWDHHFINDSYSCREDKGTLYGVLRTQRMMRKATKNFTQEAYAIKLDIRGYFMSLPRTKLFRRVEWGLKQQFQSYFNQPSAYELYQICLFLWHQVLFDDPVQKSRRRGPIEAWDSLPAEKSLYTRPYGLGIVIGNLTSQLVSNIYLDQLDRFVKFELKHPYYGRYVDDFFIIVPQNRLKQAKKDIKKIRKFLEEELELKLHSKKVYVQSIYKGIPFLGTRIYPHCLYPSNRIQQKLKNCLYRISIGKDVNNDSIISYFGFLKHMNGDQLVAKLFKKYGLNYNLYLETKAEYHRPVPEIIEELKRQAKEKLK